MSSSEQQHIFHSVTVKGTVPLNKSPSIDNYSDVNIYETFLRSCEQRQHSLNAVKSSTMLKIQQQGSLYKMKQRLFMRELSKPMQ
jgi:hypothetical protein